MWPLFFVFFFLVKMEVFNVKDYGAVGDGKTVDTESIRKCFDEASSRGGGTVVFPQPGEYLTGPFNISGNIIVEIQAKAKVVGVADFESFPVIRPLPSYGRSRDGHFNRFQPLIFGVNVKNVRITGGGEIDGNGKYWWTNRKYGKLPHGRPRLIEFLWSQNIEIDNLLLKNSPFWTVHPTYCENVHIHDIIIRNPVDSPNTDGIDPDSSSNVLIENVDVQVGDDFIAIKSGMDEAGLEYNWPSRNITIRHSKFQGAGAISIGSETSGSVFDVYVHDCIIPWGYAGVHIKTGRGRGGVVKNIRYERIEVMFAASPIGIDMYYAKSPPTHNKTTTPIVEDISYSNITAWEGVGNGIFQCLPESPCTKIRMENIHSKSIIGGYDCEYAYGEQKGCVPEACLLSNYTK